MKRTEVKDLTLFHWGIFFLFPVTFKITVMLYHSTSVTDSSLRLARVVVKNFLTFAIWVLVAVVLAFLWFSILKKKKIIQQLGHCNKARLEFLYSSMSNCTIWSSQVRSKSDPNLWQRKHLTEELWIFSEFSKSMCVHSW